MSNLGLLSFVWNALRSAQLRAGAGSVALLVALLAVAGCSPSSERGGDRGLAPVSTIGPVQTSEVEEGRSLVGAAFEFRQDSLVRSLDVLHAEHVVDRLKYRELLGAAVSAEKGYVELVFHFSAFDSRNGKFTFGCPSALEMQLPNGSRLDLKDSSGRSGVECESPMTLVWKIELSASDKSALLSSGSGTTFLSWEEKISEVVTMYSKGAKGRESGAPLRTVRLSAPVVFSFGSGEELQITTPKAPGLSRVGIKTVLKVGSSYLMHFIGAEQLSEEVGTPIPLYEIQQRCLSRQVSCKNAVVRCGKDSILFSSHEKGVPFIASTLEKTMRFALGDDTIRSACSANNLQALVRSLSSDPNLVAEGFLQQSVPGCQSCTASCLDDAQKVLFDPEELKGCIEARQTHVIGARYSTPGAVTWRSLEVPYQKALASVRATLRVADKVGTCPLTDLLETEFQTLALGESVVCGEAMDLKGVEEVVLTLEGTLTSNELENCGTVLNIEEHLSSKLPTYRTTIDCPRDLNLNRTIYSENRWQTFGPAKIYMENQARIFLKLEEYNEKF